MSSFAEQTSLQHFIRQRLPYLFDVQTPGYLCESSSLLGWIQSSGKYYPNDSFLFGHSLFIPYQANTKRIIGIILMTIESTYAAALFVVLLLNGGEEILIRSRYLEFIWINYVTQERES